MSQRKFRIGVLGSGTMGTALAGCFTKSGHEVLVGARRIPGRESMPSYQDTVARSEVIFLALSWPHGLDCVRNIDSFENRILVDVSNPESEDGRSLVLGPDESGAELIAANARGARVVKAFSHFYAEIVTGNHEFDGGLPSVLYCGDDADAKVIVHRLIAGCRFDPIDAGDLRVARYLEPMAMLTVQLVRNMGWGPSGMAWRVMREWCQGQFEGF